MNVINNGILICYYSLFNKIILIKNDESKI